MRLEARQPARQRATRPSVHGERHSVVPRSGRVHRRVLELAGEPGRLGLGEQIEQEMIVDDERHQRYWVAKIGIAGDDVSHDPVVLTARAPGRDQRPLIGLEG